MENFEENTIEPLAQHQSRERLKKKPPFEREVQVGSNFHLRTITIHIRAVTQVEPTAHAQCTPCMGLNPYAGCSDGKSTHENDKVHR